MATRFYLPFTGSSGVTAAISATWTRNPGTNYLGFSLPRKALLDALSTLGTPGTTPTATGAASEPAIQRQFISEPLNKQTISGTVSVVVKCLESALTANATLAVIIRVVSNDGGTVRGTLCSVVGTDTEFPTTAATRILSASALSSVNAEMGDRLVVELGMLFSTGAAATSGALNFGTSGGSDYALTTALTTTINPWVEFSQDLFLPVPNNYQFIQAGTGLSTSGRIR